MATSEDMTFYIKKGDLRPNVDATLLDPDGIAQDLTGHASVKFKMKKSGVLVVNGTCSVTDQTVEENHGKVRYVWVAGDTDTAGTYQCEFEVTWADNDKQTYPNGSYGKVIIKKDLDA